MLVGFNLACIPYALAVVMCTFAVQDLQSCLTYLCILSVCLTVLGMVGSMGYLPRCLQLQGPNAV